MHSRKSKSEPNIAEAAEKTGLRLRELQSRLSDGNTPVPDPPSDTAADLERQLQEYFECWPGEPNPATPALDRIRNRVIDGVAERILRRWQQDPKAHPFENEIIDRLIDGVLNTLTASDAPARKARGLPALPKSPAIQM